MAGPCAGARRSGCDDGSARDYQGDPVEVGAEQVEDLQPGGCEQKHVGCSEEELHADEGDDKLAELAAKLQGDPDGAAESEEGSRGVQPAHANEQRRLRGEVLEEGGLEGGWGEERVGERGDGAGAANEECGDERDPGDGAGVGAEVGGRLGAVAEPPPGEGDGGEQQHGVGEVDALHDDAHVGGVALDVAAFDEERAEERFGDEKDAGPDDGAAGAVAAGACEECPGDERRRPAWCRCRSWSGG